MREENKILMQKLAVVCAVNAMTLTFDAFANYRLYNKQLSQMPRTSIFSPSASSFVSQITGNNVKGLCFALAAYADVQYVIGNDEKCDINDLNDVKTNSVWLALHLTKTLVRSLEIANS